MKIRIAALLLCAAAVADAGSLAASTLRSESANMIMKLETCAIRVQTVFVKIRARLPMDKDDDVSRCPADGKAAVKESYESIKAQVPPKAAAALAALADWRLEWMSAFDAAVPQDSDTERDYMGRQSRSKQAVSRAANRFEMSLDN